MSTELDIQTVLAQARDVALDLSGAAVAAFESRCALTKSECEGLHFSACRSRLPDGECTNNVLTPTECLGASCGSVQDFSNPVGECEARSTQDFSTPCVAAPTRAVFIIEMERGMLFG